MSISSAIGNAFSGLRAAQAGMDLVAQNVANAGAAGYTRRVLNAEQLVAGGRTIGVDVQGATRTLNALVQRQLRLEQAGEAYAAIRADAQLALEASFDKPGGVGALSSLVDGFASKLQTLANNPASAIAQADVLSAASDLAGTLNGLSGQVQALRQDAENAIDDAVARADSLLQAVAALNGTIMAGPSAALEDRRDALLDQLSTLLDLKVTLQPSGAATLATTGGLQLVDGTTAIRLSFDPRHLGPESAWSTDPTRRGTGTIIATDGTGAARDILAAGLIRSGEIAAHVELRDRILPQAQAQLDELAAGLAASLSDRRVEGAAVTAGASAGFDLDLAGLSAGNTLTVSVADAGGAVRTLSFVKATSAAGAAAATDGGRIGIDFSAGLGSVAARIGAALGAGYAVSNPSGATLRILAGPGQAVNAASAQETVTALASGHPELPLFVDGGRAGAAYTGSYDGGSQALGFAARIALNPAVRDNRGSLVVFGPATAAGDQTRPLFLLDRLTVSARDFAGEAGIGGSNAPWTGTVAGFAREVIATQASEAAAARNLHEGQRVVLAAVRSRFDASAAVNIDEELTQLIQLQTAYGANARLISAAQEMMDLLLRMVA